MFQCFEMDESSKRSMKLLQVLFHDTNNFRNSHLGNVKLISCLALHGKKLNAQCAKMILFS